MVVYHCTMVPKWWYHCTQWYHHCATIVHWYHNGSTIVQWYHNGSTIVQWYHYGSLRGTIVCILMWAYRPEIQIVSEHRYQYTPMQIWMAGTQ